MPRHGWQRPDGDWSKGWEYRPGSEAWRGFGKRMALGFAMFFILGPLLFVGALVALVTVVSNVSASVWLVIAAVPFVLVVTLIVIGRLVFRTVLPVRGLIRAAGSLADGDYAVRVETSSPAVRPVVESFNSMAAQLESADQQRRRLLADLGHELRTPLTVVRGEIEAMLDGVHETDPDHLALLLDEVGTMERLLEDLRTLSLAEAGALALHPEPTDVADLVADVAEAHRRSAESQGVLVSVNVPRSLPEVMADPVRLREVVANLVVNSLRAMPDGGALRLGVREERGAILITVGDSGIGMTGDELDRAFERFHKGSTSSGSGLGLTISRDLIAAHGGTITMESEPGEGTTVSVRIPKVVAG